MIPKTKDQDALQFIRKNKAKENQRALSICLIYLEEGRKEHGRNSFAVLNP